MKVILLQNVAKIGKKFDIKEVSDGYALNFLLPNKLAKMATAKAEKEIEIDKQKHQESMKAENEKLMEVVNKIKEVQIEITANANEEGKLFAGLGAKEISEAISNQSGEIIKSEMIELENPIKEIGEHQIGIKAGDTVVKVTLEVKAEEK
ncbi:50S ribosomal protein L9 [Patescibacteria group bacterium]|nr:50S ribosomal protein L9 [Patescibacteria group bacterium]